MVVLRNRIVTSQAAVDVFFLWKEFGSPGLRRPISSDNTPQTLLRLWNSTGWSVGEDFLIILKGGGSVRSLHGCGVNGNPCLALRRVVVVERFARVCILLKLLLSRVNHAAVCNGQSMLVLWHHSHGAVLSNDEARHPVVSHLLMGILKLGHRRHFGSGLQRVRQRTKAVVDAGVVSLSALGGRRAKLTIYVRLGPETRPIAALRVGSLSLRWRRGAIGQRQTRMRGRCGLRLGRAKLRLAEVGRQGYGRRERLGGR